MTLVYYTFQRINIYTICVARRLAPFLRPEFSLSSRSVLPPRYLFRFVARNTRDCRDESRRGKSRGRTAKDRCKCDGSRECKSLRDPEAFAWILANTTDRESLKVCEKRKRSRIRRVNPRKSVKTPQNNRMYSRGSLQTRRIERAQRSWKKLAREMRALSQGSAKEKK